MSFLYAYPADLEVSSEFFRLWILFLFYAVAALLGWSFSWSFFKGISFLPLRVKDFLIRGIVLFIHG